VEAPRYINSQSSRLGTPLALQVIPALSTPNRTNKRGARRARQNKTPGSDAIRLTGRQSLVPIQTANLTGPAQFVLDPSAFGDRVASVAGNFTRYRIKSLRFQYRPLVGTTEGGLITYGVLDDVVGYTTAPTSRDQILNLRRATETSYYKNSALSWRPLDASKWYYVAGSTTSSGDRFEIPGTLYIVNQENNLGSEGTTAGYLDVLYVIEFAGAAVTALSLAAPPPPSVPTSTQPASPAGYVSIAKPLTSLRR